MSDSDRRLPGWGASNRAAAPRAVQAETVAVERRRLASKPRGPLGQHEDDGWTRVGRAGKAPRGRDAGPGSQAPSQACCGSHSDNSWSHSSGTKPRPRGDFLARELLAVGEDESLVSTITTALVQHWRQEPTTIVALGLGSPTTSAPSRHQLALTVLLTSRLGLKECQVFDPVLDADDIELLSHHGCRVLTAAESLAAYQSTAGGSVLFVMPHCELELYDAVLAANWDAGRLSTIAILGNSFSDYVERNPSRTSKLGKHVCLIQACTQEFSVVASREHPISAFNNMALHIFAVPKNSILPADVGEAGTS